MIDSSDLERRVSDLERERLELRFLLAIAFLFVCDAIHGEARDRKAPDHDDGQDFLTYAQAAQLAEVTPEAIRKHAQRGTLKKVTRGMKPGVSREALEAIMNVKRSRGAKSARR